MACGLRKILLAIFVVIDAQVLARTVEHHNSVVDRKAEHGENRRHKQRVYLRAGEVPEESEKSHGNDNVVHECHERDEAIYPTRDGLRDFAKCERYEKQYAKKYETERENRLVAQFSADGRADFSKLVYMRRAALIREDCRQLASLCVPDALCSQCVPVGTGLTKREVFESRIVQCVGQSHRVRPRTACLPACAGRRQVVAHLDERASGELNAEVKPEHSDRNQRGEHECSRECEESVAMFDDEHSR